MARGAWENTNKAVIAEYFHESSVRNAAFAMAYFSSGFAGAFGYLFFKFMGRLELGAVNLAVSALAILCYHLSFCLFEQTSPVRSLEKVYHEGVSLGTSTTGETYSAVHVSDQQIDGDFIFST